MSLKIVNGDTIKIKNIDELDQIEKLSSSANVLIEENGSAKRIAANKILIEGGIGGSGDSITLNPVVVGEKAGVQIIVDKVDGTQQTYTIYNGEDGEDGETGVTYLPEIREDGYLEWSNNSGAPNPAPAKVKGEDGKSAYEYAQEGGYTGTEEEFSELLASGAGSGVSVQSDLAQNDPTQSDYVKNRTHWEEDNQTVHPLDEKFVPETIARKTDVIWESLPDKPFYTETVEPEVFEVANLQFSPQVNQDDVGIYMAQLGSSTEFMTLYEGNKYTVNWDGVITETECRFVLIDGTNMYQILGNGSLVRSNLGNSGENFCIIKMLRDSTGTGNFQHYATLFASSQFLTSHSISVTSPGIIVHQIDKKFVPTRLIESALPAVTENDNGKILRVVGGKWVVTHLTNAEVTSY